MDGQMVLSDFGVGKKQLTLEEILKDDVCYGCLYITRGLGCDYPDTPDDYCICGNKKIS